MNANNRTVPTRFGPETRFEVRPAPPAPFRATQETELERLKNRLLRETLYSLTETGSTGFVRRAANEAAALAWVTPYPLLMFPALFEEKARTALLQARRQVSVRERSLELFAVRSLARSLTPGTPAREPSARATDSRLRKRLPVLACTKL